MRHLSGYTDGFPKRPVRVNRFADVHCVSAHFDGQCNLADHVASVHSAIFTLRKCNELQGVTWGDALLGRNPRRLAPQCPSLQHDVIAPHVPGV